MTGLTAPCPQYKEAPLSGWKGALASYYTVAESETQAGYRAPGRRRAYTAVDDTHSGATVRSTRAAGACYLTARSA